MDYEVMKQLLNDAYDFGLERPNLNDWTKHRDAILRAHFPEREAEASGERRVRCNHCMSVYDEEYIDVDAGGPDTGETCPCCGKGDALMDMPRPAPRDEKALEALKVVYDGNELAAERGESIKNWPTSYARKLAREVLYPSLAREAPKTFDEAIGETGGAGIAEFERESPKEKA